MKYMKLTSILILSPFLVGCGEILDSKLDRYFPLNTKNEGESIIFSSKSPSNTLPRVRVEYISTKCTKMSLNAAYTKVNHQDKKSKTVWDIENKGNNNFETKIPLNGGGWCDWKLNQIVIGLIYDKNRFINKDVELSESSNLFIKIENDNNKVKSNTSINYIERIYPVYEKISEKYERVFFISPHRGEKYNMSLPKNTNGYIYYSPKLNESKVTHVFISGRNSFVKYPNGEINYNTSHIDYQKIDNIIFN
ncbi:hypothetical protein FE392_19280 [Xenorhabdus sp. 12]|uniref:Lipoprotein n=1 Tax=Xenorhabdus santafensis TaxID=2582833 RepID=A0ABU4SF23_9GAMM|nr:hypothetical protein [Xenorhabdus sp. 12]MDX7989408.1 hypothetical protein [Xenorhabdus sp. 12]